MKTKRMKEIGCIIVLALFVLCSFSMGKANAQSGAITARSEAVKQLYEAAKKEGTVVIWGPSDSVIYRKAQEIFDRQYPGIKIENFESLPDPVVQRVITESQAGKSSDADIIQSGSMRGVRPLIDRDLLAAFPGWEKDFDLDAVYAGHRLVGSYNLSFPIGYNTKMVSAQDAPKSWEDLSDPKWKGRKIIVEARLVAYALLSMELGKEKVMDMVKQLLAQDPIIVKGGTTTVNALAAGQGALAVGLYGYKVEKLKRKGAPVDWVPVSPLPMISSAMGVLKSAPHPHAARFFTGWLGSADGQKVVYEQSGQASLIGKAAYGPEAEKIKTAKPKIILETDKNFATIVKMQRELGKIIGALR